MGNNQFFERYAIDYTKSLDLKGHGAVYLSYNTIDEVNVAVKVIEILKISDKGELVKRYNDSKSFDHPNVLKIIDFHFVEGEDTIKYFMVMPLVDFPNLQEYSSSLSFQQKNNILKEILNGLKYLHNNGFVWQNLRADHILLQKKDKNLSPLFINCYNKEKLKKAYFYNYEYLSPEQLDQNKDSIDYKTDIWSLGVLIFYLFTDVLPFGKKSVQFNNKKIQDRILNNEIAELSNQIPEPFLTITNKCLRIDPNQSWENLEEIINFLETNENLRSTAKREVGILDTLQKLDDNSSDNEKGKISFFERKIKRKPGKPISVWEPLLWLLFSLMIGYIISKL